MPKIEFRGQIYNNEFEMPYGVRQAYLREKERRAEKSKKTEKSLSDVVDMSPEVKAMYEKALGNVDEKLTSSRSLKGLPNTDEIFRQSAPEDMKHLPSDESIYRPSQRLIDPVKSAIEPEAGWAMKRFISSLVWALILIVLAFIVIQFLL